MNLLLIFGAGFLGSGHCIGMCGPFAIAIASGAKSWLDCAARQLMFGCGRIFTYMFLGILAGFAGSRLSQYENDFVHIPAALAVISGIVLIYLGLSTIGWLPQRAHAKISCLVTPLFRTFLDSKSKFGFLIAGVLTGFLPCGLVYAMVTMAAAQGTLQDGALVMLAFGLGTVPVMTLTGVGASWLSLGARERMFKIAAWCVVVAGVLSIARGVGYFQPDAGLDPDACPFCEAREAE